MQPGVLLTPGSLLIKTLLIRNAREFVGSVSLASAGVAAVYNLRPFRANVPANRAFDSFHPQTR